ncbi:MAG: hypothetical protein ACLFRN_10290 [Halothece sp.]
MNKILNGFKITLDFLEKERLFLANLPIGHYATVKTKKEKYSAIA